MISDFTLAKLGLRIVKEEVGREVELYIEDKNTGERSMCSKCRKLFSLDEVKQCSGVVLPSECKDVALVIDSNVMEGTVAAAAVTSTVDLRKLEARIGHLHPNECQRLCSSWNMQLNRQDQDHCSWPSCVPRTSLGDGRVTSSCKSHKAKQHAHNGCGSAAAAAVVDVSKEGHFAIVPDVVLCAVAGKVVVKLDKANQRRTVLAGFVVWAVRVCDRVVEFEVHFKRPERARVAGRGVDNVQGRGAVACCGAFALDVPRLCVGKETIGRTFQGARHCGARSFGDGGQGLGINPGEAAGGADGKIVASIGHAAGHNFVHIAAVGWGGRMLPAGDTVPKSSRHCRHVDEHHCACTIHEGRHGGTGHGGSHVTAWLCASGQQSGRVQKSMLGECSLPCILVPMSDLPAIVKEDHRERCGNLKNDLPHHAIAAAFEKVPPQAIASAATTTACRLCHGLRHRTTS